MIWIPKKRREEIKKRISEEQDAKLRRDFAKTSEKVVFRKN
ncbi:hypothetical protein [Methanobrevibacter millerae]|uniref:Uncharacterized protein n=1 Tax=Methanobrevibacter millerae TaxID=230361 RepID=A0A1G5VIA4_9EURY|nr:hypothetical protein [Methanobrevibacter millerae]SDA45550.1 hypothetical protein SAMN02910315_00635 [Methanobrevibacter millerae]